MVTVGESVLIDLPPDEIIFATSPFHTFTSELETEWHMPDEAISTKRGNMLHEELSKTKYNDRWL